jgi:hypothetical protein
MGRKHQAWGTALIQDGNTVSVGVGKGFVGKRFDVIEPDPLSAGFKSGWAWGVYQGSQKIQGWRTHERSLATGAGSRNSKLSLKFGASLI